MIAGTQAVTLFCGRADPDIAIGALRSTGAPVKAARRWKDISAPVGPGSLRLVRRMFKPGGSFSSVILGAHLAVSEAEADDEARATVLAALETCDMMLGVSFKPPLVDGDARWAATLVVAQATEALIFDGLTFADAAERPLLDI